MTLRTRAVTEALYWWLWVTLTSSSQWVHVVGTNLIKWVVTWLSFLALECVTLRMMWNFFLGCQEISFRSLGVGNSLNQSESSSRENLLNNSYVPSAMCPVLCAQCYVPSAILRTVEWIPSHKRHTQMYSYFSSFEITFSTESWYNFPFY